MLLIVYFDPFADFFGYFLEVFEIIRKGVFTSVALSLLRIEFSYDWERSLTFIFFDICEVVFKVLDYNFNH